MTFEQIQYVAGIYANLRDALPKRYKAELHFSCVTTAYICILDARTYHTVLRHTWEEGDTESSFEAALEARLQSTGILRAKENSSSVDDV
jgi:hypothetical protein